MVRRSSIALICLAAQAVWPVAAQPRGDWRTDIEFARVGDISLTLDAWVPEGRGPFPTVIVVHGGGWEAGDKGAFVPPLFEPLKNGGFTWFTINYRLAPAHPFPACVDDAFRAIEWVKDHAREYKADPNRIALMGESAGGHIVAYCGARGRGKTRVRAVVDFYGAHDFLLMVKARGLFRNLTRLFSVTEMNAETERKLREASPITYVHRGMPPFLFIHGTKDAAVAYEQSPLMCEAMKKAGARCEVYTVDEGPHGIGPWEKNPAWQGYKGRMVDWLKATLN
jgi:alpha-L-fucosidase 2